MMRESRRSWLTLDSHGLITEIAAQDRPRKENGRFVERANGLGAVDSATTVNIAGIGCLSGRSWMDD
jgi:hypothetical protein